MNKKQIELVGDNHMYSSIQTPLSTNAFKKTDDEKIEKMILKQVFKVQL